ncbi:hypothetical protein DVH05_004506 [Phytophthora capsici]|nr:hypothetical protein DVH05_004506 [Phytophthora capsici]
MPRKPMLVPTDGAKAIKAAPPKTPSKSPVRGTPTKVSTSVKPLPSVQPTAQQAVAESSIDIGPDSSAIPATEGTSGAPIVENQLDTAETAGSTDGAPVAGAFRDDIAAEEAAEEVERLRKINGTGLVKLIYESYDELFAIENGSTTQANIDEVYCLSFMMPNCLVRLSQHPNPERFQREESGVFDSLVREDPQGTYHDLETDRTYYVVVEQEADQLRRDQEAAKALWDGEIQKQKKTEKEDGRGFESCSCIYGNPCVDEYGCRDWHSRFAVATKNGWKGF